MPKSGVCALESACRALARGIRRDWLAGAVEQAERVACLDARGMVVLEVQDDAYPSRGLWAASIRVVPDVPSNPADDELTRADEFAAAGRCLDP